MAGRWLGMPPKSLLVLYVRGVYYDRQGRMLAIGTSSGYPVLPGTRVHAGEAPGDALASWLAQRGVRVLAGGPLTYRRRPASTELPAHVVAYRVGIIECETDQAVKVARVLMSGLDATGVALAGEIGQFRLWSARRAARGMWAARRAPEPQPPRPPARVSIRARHATGRPA